MRRSTGFAVVGFVALSSASLRAQAPFPLVGHDRAVRTIEFLPGGEVLASGGDDGTVRLWNVKTQELIATLEHERGVGRLWVAPDATLLVTAAPAEPRTDGRRQEQLVFWDVGSRGPATRFDKLSQDRFQDINDVVFSPDGRWLVTSTFQGGRNEPYVIRLWDTATGDEVAVLRDKDRLHWLAFSPDAKTIAASGNYGFRRGRGGVVLWDVNDFGESREVSHDDNGWYVQFSPDSKLLAVAAMKHLPRPINRVPSGVRLFDVQSRKLVATLDGFVGHISSMAFSPDGRYFAAAATLPGSWGEVPGEVMQGWDLTAGTRIILERDSHVHSLQFSPDGRTLANSFTTPECGIKLWDLERGGAPRILRQAKPRSVLTNVRYSPDGRWLAATATSDNPTERLVLWDLEAYRTDAP